MLLTVHATGVVAQPILAGRFMSVEVDAIDPRGSNGSVLVASGLIIMPAAAAYVFAWRGRWWALPATVLMFFAEGFQVGLGHQHALAAHIPLGVGIVVAAGALGLGVEPRRSCSTAPEARMKAELTRRDALRLLGVAVAAGGVAGCGRSGSTIDHTGELVASAAPLPPPYQVPLPLPPVAGPVRH